MCSKCNCQIERVTSWHPLVREWDSKENYFTQLELKETATEDDIRHTYEGLQNLFYGDEKDMLKKKEAYEFLIVEDNRKLYLRYVCFMKGFFTKVRWTRAIIYGRRNQWPMLGFEIVFSTLLIISGLVVSIFTGSLLATRILVGMIAGGLLCAGVLSLIFLIAVESVVEEGREKWYMVTDGYLKKLLGGALGGAVGGLMTVGISIAILGHPEQEDATLDQYVIESCLSVALDVYMFTLADGLVTGSYLVSSARAIVFDLTLTLISGSLAGALGGLMLGNADIIDEFVGAVLKPLSPWIPQLVQGLVSIVTCSCRNITKESTSALLQNAPPAVTSNGAAVQQTVTASPI